MDTLVREKAVSHLHSKYIATTSCRTCSRRCRHLRAASRPRIPAPSRKLSAAMVERTNLKVKQKDPGLRGGFWLSRARAPFDFAQGRSAPHRFLAELPLERTGVDARPYTSRPNPCSRPNFVARWLRLPFLRPFRQRSVGQACPERSRRKCPTHAFQLKA
jgi:hypothetical protein